LISKNRCFTSGLEFPPTLLAAAVALMAAGGSK